MNYRLVFKIIGKTMLIAAALLLVPVIVALVYKETDKLSAFIIPAAALCAIGAVPSCIKIKERSYGAKEGFVIVALCWLLLSFAGCVPFIVSGEIPGLADAFFETVSGFTTTGASVLSDVEILSSSVMFWRIFTHWIGGMGVLVFVLTVIPESETGGTYIFSAESPGPSATKIVGKMKYTAQILYGIYIVLTAICTLFLVCGGMSFYDSLLNAFSTAGTGGLSVHNGSIAYYKSAYVEIVLSVFMFLFGVNFNVYFLIVSGSVLKALKSEEMITYVVMLAVSAFVIAVNITGTVANFGVALRQAFFQVTSISSTTGASTANFDKWPALSKSVLLFLTMIGACGGSTGGGVKVSRMVILLKSCFADIRKTVNKREVVAVKFENKPLTRTLVSGVYSFFALYIFIVIVATVLLSFGSFAEGDVLTHFTASLTCISNVGPGLNFVGPTCSFAGYNAFSKCVLSFVMLAGRLEIYPMLILFAPRTWKR